MVATSSDSTLRAKNQPIILAVFSWWFAIKPKQLFYIYSKVIRKIRQFFSMSLLLRTLFAPWKRDEIDMGTLSLQDRFRVLIMNLVSRLVGAAVRGGTVMVGVISVILVTAGFFVATTGFVLLPLFSIILLIVAFSGGAA